LYAFSFVIYSIAQLCRIPKKLDDDRAAREQSLNDSIAEKDDAIRKLISEPKRTPAEQHDYETAKRALEVVREKGITALRHIRRHGSLTFAYGSSSSPLPPGLTFNDTLWVYNHCASEGLLTCNEKYGSGEKTFTVSPKMSKVLDELLYVNDSSTV
jgi:hypothetical protein